MNWSDLRFALAVARASSVVEAADQLGVAHTTVYRRIRRLEQEQGVKLFDRRENGDQLTEVGREMVRVAEGVEAQIEALERHFRTHDTRPSGKVSVAAVEPMAQAMTRYITAFRREHPSLQVSLSVTNDIVAIGQDVDIALRITREPKESLVGRKIADIAFAVYAHRDLVGHGELDLAQCPFVCFDDSVGRTPQARWETAHVRPEQVALRTNARAVFMQALADGVGAGVAPCGLAAEQPELVAITGVLEGLSMPLWLLTHEELVREPRVRVLLDYLAAVLIPERSRLEGHPG